MKLCDLSRSIALWGLARWQSKLHGLMHLRGPAKGGSHVARLNFRTSRVGVYKCLSLIVSFAVIVTI